VPRGMLVFVAELPSLDALPCMRVISPCTRLGDGAGGEGGNVRSGMTWPSRCVTWLVVHEVATNKAAAAAMTARATGHWPWRPFGVVTGPHSSGTPDRDVEHEILDGSTTTGT